MIPEYSGSFTVCCVCAGLAGYPRGRSDYPQVCRCNRADEQRWPDHDFNEYADLCWCCLLETISSGSKWSSFYCDDCRQRVRKYNQSMGRVLLWMGRHSIMNGLGLRGPDVAVPQAVATFGTGLGGFVTGLGGFYDAMAAWRPDRLGAVLQAGGLEGAGGEEQRLPLAQYLKAAAGLANHPEFRKGAAFDALCGFMGFPSRSSR